jgi:GntR family transcriptional regulator/MocR family aminotransferase
VVIVSGAQQGLDLVSRVLLRPRDTAVLEDPHYQGARQALRAHGARLVMVPVDDDGIVSERLPRRGACLVSVTPSHQFPTGVVLSLPRAWRCSSGHGATTPGSSRTTTTESSATTRARWRVEVARPRRSRALPRHVLEGAVPGVAARLSRRAAALREAVVAGKWLLDRGCPAIDRTRLRP